MWANGRHTLHSPPSRRLYGAPGECEIGTRMAGTKAVKGGTVHAILPGLKGPDTLQASSCSQEQVLGTTAPCTCSAPPVLLLGPPLRHSVEVNEDGDGAFQQAFVSEPCLYIKTMSRWEGKEAGAQGSTPRVASPQIEPSSAGQAPSTEARQLNLSLHVKISTIWTSSRGMDHHSLQALEDARATLWKK